MSEELNAAEAKLAETIREAGADYESPGAVAHAVVEAGWVSPEEHAEYVAMEGRFSELLCDLTDGLLSKTGYDVRAMVQQVEETFEKYAAEAWAEVWDEAAQAVYEWCHGVTGKPSNPYRTEEQGA